MLLGWLIRLLLIALVAHLVWRALSAAFSGSRPPAPRATTPRQVSLVRDPVCGTYLEPTRALRTRSGTTTHYFCSKRCQQAFLETA